MTRKTVNEPRKDVRDDAHDVRELVGEGLDTVREAAGFLAVSVSQLYALMGQGQLPFVKIGKSRRIPRKAVIDLAVRGLVRRAAE